MLTLDPSTALQHFTTEHWPGASAEPPRPSVKACEIQVKDFGSTAKAATEWFTKQKWTDVKFKSRDAKDVPQVDLTAYYFAAPKAPDHNPTIVITHGNNVNNRDHTVLTAAYFLNSMGFNALVLNLRNHGDSGSTGPICWAQTEAYDTLGAWDYVVKDPEGKLGFAQKPERTALMGFSMGGLISRVAFGLEPQIPVLLTDSSVWNGRDILRYFIDLALPFGGWIIDPAAWFWAKRITGYDLDNLLPAKLFKRKGDTRVMGNLHGTNDDVVPVSQSQAFKAFIKDTDFKVFEEWYPAYEKDVVEKCAHHCTIHTYLPDQYQAFLCKFFSKAFGRDAAECGLKDTSSFTYNAKIESAARRSLRQIGRQTPENYTLL